ncbi:unnamed protein product [Rotaria magnacalcarata]|uniref:Uncharacterized protein n=1 Tax=Rotaria magnacalcarata TaxID=392030 RepID=A0A816R9D8_9BILA|nr:unnamed protein product [Rotaria magnacalcarata]
MYHHPHFTYNRQQHANPSNVSTKNQHLVTSTDEHPLINNRAHHQCIQNGVTPMETKVIPESVVTPDLGSPTSSSSTSSCNTDQSTSSSNTDSGTSNGKPINKPISTNSRAQTRTNEYTSANAKPSTSEISEQSRRFAEARFAFPPFVIKFHNAVDGKTIINYMVNHFISEYKINLNFAGHRLKSKNELLLFSANRETFIMLCDGNKWPTSIVALNYEKNIPKHLPPQFSIVLRNRGASTQAEKFS